MFEYSIWCYSLLVCNLDVGGTLHSNIQLRLKSNELEKECGVTASCIILPLIYL